MRKAISLVVFTATAVVLSATSALAGATYPPTPHKRTVPPGPPTAFTGAEISTPMKVMAALVIIGLMAFIAAIVFVRPKES
jgi:hypothetical protein